jgi:hypothetical protein
MGPYPMGELAARDVRNRSARTECPSNQVSVIDLASRTLHSTMQLLKDLILCACTTPHTARDHTCIEEPLIAPLLPNLNGSRFFLTFCRQHNDDVSTANFAPNKSAFRGFSHSSDNRVVRSMNCYAVACKVTISSLHR